MDKTIICNWGRGDQGKTSTIRKVFEKLRWLFPHSSFNILIDDGDLKAKIQINEIWIGIESQGDPDSRLTYEKLSDFLDCDIIICACRSRGITVAIVEEFANNNDYRIIWVTNHRNEEQNDILNDTLNDLSSQSIYNLIEKIFVI